MNLKPSENTQLHGMNYFFNEIIKLYNEKTEEIQIYQKNEDELSLFIKKLYEIKNIKEIYRNSTTDSNIVSLNILENCISWIFSTSMSYKKKIGFQKSLSKIIETPEIVRLRRL